MKQILEQGTSLAQSNAERGRIGSVLNSRVRLQDCLFLGIIVLLSLVLYVKDLGLYSDDWHFLGLLSNASDQSLFGLIGSVFPDTRLRPMQTLYVAGLYWLFGPHPLGYHVVNAMVFTLTIILLYLSLSELIRSRLLTIALPLVYSLLPHYSTDRFWYIAFVANLSMGLYFLSLYADLRVLRAQKASVFRWRLLSIFGLLCSALAYEVILPLFLLNPLLVWWRAQTLRETASRRPLLRTVLGEPLAINVLVIALVAAYKILITRSGVSGFVHNFVIYGDYSSHLLRLATGAIGVNFGSYGLGLPIKIWRVLRLYPNPKILAGSVLTGLIIFVYLYRAISRPPSDLPEEADYFKLMGVGLIVFVSGYAIFLTNSNVAFATAGISNRVVVAAALGVAMLFVAGIGWFSWVLPSQQVRRIAFCLLVALLCSGGFLLNNTIASFWITASRQQREIIAAVRQKFSTLPPDTTLILDGVCPYTGPGIVFECYWDVSGMLRTYYHDSSIRGDVAKRNLQVSEQGLDTRIYGERKIYPYCNQLFVFNVGQNEVYGLKDAEAARLYFQNTSPGRDNCADGSEGEGTPIF